MHASTRSTLLCSTLAFAAPLAGLAAPAMAQGTAPAAPAATGSQALIDAAALFVHNVMIAKPDAATAAANVLLADAVAPSDLALAIDGADMGKRMDEAFRRSRRMAEVADASAALETKLEVGRTTLARKIERIEEAVKMLVGPIRGQMLAKDRLVAAGEYAVPALLRQVVEGRDLALEAASTRVLVDMRRQAVLPLMLAVPALDASAQRKVCVILGELGYPIAIPVLLDIAYNAKTTPDVSEAAKNAASMLGAKDMTAAAAYVAAARQFLTVDISLIAYPDDPTQNIWKWTEFGGLAADKISTRLYFDAMSMLFSRRALELDAGNGQALALFIAADLRREAAMGEGMVDPLFAGQGRSAQFYATVAGPKTMQEVLRLGLSMNDTLLVRSSLAALRETAGAGEMIADGSTPVVGALLYPDRRVQFEAAIALASVSPKSAFSGSEQVVPLLAQAVRAGGQTFAGIICASSEDSQRLANSLKGNGFVPLTAAADAAGFEVVSARNAGSDLVVISGSAPQIREHFTTVRSMRAGSTLPILVVAQPADKGSLDELERDGRTVVLGVDVDDKAFKAGVDALVSRAFGGRMTADDMSRYVSQSLDALLRIGLANGPVYRIGDAERGLVEALRSQEGPVRLAVANVLALVGTEGAQRALAETALSATGDEQAMLFGPVAQSARRFGNLTTSAQSDAIRQVVQTATGATAEAAAAAYGALSLPSSEAVELIIKSRQPGVKPAETAAPSEKGDAAMGATRGG